jgi:hypothetical protein
MSYLGVLTYIVTALLVARRLHVSRGDKLMESEILFLGAIWPIFLTFTAVTRLIKATVFGPTPSERKAKQYEQEEAERRKAEKIIAAYDRSNRAFPDSEKIVDLAGNTYAPRDSSDQVRSVIHAVMQMNTDELRITQLVIQDAWRNHLVERATKEDLPITPDTTEYR